MSNILKNIFFVIVIAAFAGSSLLSGCKSAKVKIPYDIIPEKKMQLVLVDVLCAESYAGLHPIPADTTRKITSTLYQKIFDKYQISKTVYYNSYHFYATHPALFEKIMVPVLDSLNAIDARIPQVYNRAPVPSGPVTVISK